MHPLMMNALDPKVQARLARRLGLPFGTEPPRLSRRLVLQGLAGSGLVLGFGLPGGTREPAPGTQEQFGALIAAWIETGAACPR